MRSAKRGRAKAMFCDGRKPERLVGRDKKKRWFAAIGRLGQPLRPRSALRQKQAPVARHAQGEPVADAHFCQRPLCFDTFAAFGFVARYGHAGNASAFEFEQEFVRVHRDMLGIAGNASPEKRRSSKTVSVFPQRHRNARHQQDLPEVRAQVDWSRPATTSPANGLKPKTRSGGL